ncbi:chloride channel protein 2 [Aplysia californica]|uniref:Chloride channel protein 2 n=1 Tax=Aplysia californica TaxID=6500 RepID=A0ABM1W436_APLCA|nr:chloride channel protein 2 [Aplysia californica]
MYKKCLLHKSPLLSFQLYGQYTKDLGAFAKFQATKVGAPDVEQAGKKDVFHSKYFFRIRQFLKRCADVRDAVFLRVGEDWIFLTILGITMAFLSFTMDFIIEKCQEAKFWLYDELQFSMGLQYCAWVLYSMLFILFAVGFTHLVSPQAIGSGIPEMKTILRGVVLKEYLTFRTLVAKIVGLCSSLGSTLPFGKEGPFVHIASIVATILSKGIRSFRGIYENESRRSEMLAAACAVGVAGTFAAPIGGVLFSIEVTATYFAVRNYWRGVFSAVCGALVFRLMAFWFKDEETLTALFRTNLRTEFPFDALELFAFASIGVACGFGGALFILTHRSVILFTRRHKKLSHFLQKNRFIYPSIITFVIASLTFPPGLGQFFGGKMTGKMAIHELFSNITWTTGQAEDIDDEAILEHWRHPQTNIYVTLVLFIIMNFLMAVFSNTLPIPAGVFVPVFTIGAAFGRLVGESMAAWFPEGIPSGDIVRKIVPGGYAVVGAASLSGSVTRTISTAVIVFEVTGQISHVLPAVISVLIANAVANMLQPSFYDSIIKLKKLPYLPDIVSAKSNLFVCSCTEEMNNFYRKLAQQRKDSIIEDRPMTLDKGSLPNLCKKVKLGGEAKPTKIRYLPYEDQEAWELEQLQQPIDWEGVQIDPAPFQLVERTSLHKVHSLFSLLGLSHAFVTNTGRLVGVVGLKELRVAVQGQIELQENGKKTVSDPSVGQEEEEGREEESTAPIDDARLEVVREPAPSTVYRLHSINAADRNKNSQV